MEAKICSTCSVMKPLDQFTASKKGLGGCRSICKKCSSIAFAEWRKRRISQDPDYRQKEVARATKWARDNPEARAKIAKRRNQKAQEGSPEKVRARALVNQRVRFGRIPKASSLCCVVCNSTAAHYHHHLGYEFEHRYDVVPVCHVCHKILDAETNPGSNG